MLIENITTMSKGKSVHTPYDHENIINSRLFLFHGPWEISRLSNFHSLRFYLHVTDRQYF